MRFRVSKSTGVDSAFSIIDVHSHLADEPSPALAGANDGNSIKGLTLPWLRSLDALNTHDEGLSHSLQ
jgi:hypothetical protein